MSKHRKNDCKADPLGYNILAAEQSRTDVKLENQVLIKTQKTSLFMLGTDVVELLCNRCGQGRESLGGCVPMTAAKFSCDESS